jgi:hypothetical protein
LANQTFALEPTDSRRLVLGIPDVVDDDIESDAEALGQALGCGQAEATIPTQSSLAEESVGDSCL